MLMKIFTAYASHYSLGCFYLKQKLDPNRATFGNWDWGRIVCPAYSCIRIDGTFGRKVEPGNSTKLPVD